MSIPRYDPQPVGKVTSMPTISFVGEEASEQTMTELARSGYRLAAAGEEMRSAAEQNYFDSLQVDVLTNFSKIKSQHASDPEGLRKALGGYIDSVVDNVPFAFEKTKFKNALNLQAARDYASAVSSMASQAQAISRAEAKASNELLKRDIVDMGAPVSLQDQQLLVGKIEMYRGNLQRQVAAGVMAPSEAALQLRDLEDDQKASMALGAIQNSENKSQTYADLMIRKSKYKELNQMSPTQRQKLTAQFQALLSVEQNLLNTTKDDKKESAKRVVQTYLNSFLDDASQIATASGQIKLHDMRLNAVTVGDMDIVNKTEDYVHHFGEERFKNSNPDVLKQAADLIDQREMTPLQLIRLWGDGLSTEDYRGLKARQESLEQSIPSADLGSIKAQVDSVIQSTVPTFWQQARSLSFGKYQPNVQGIELAKKSFYRDLNEGWLNGSIPHNSQGLQQFLEQRKAGLLQAAGSKEVPTPSVNAAVISQNPDITTLADKYTSWEQLLQDKNAGVITDKQARQIDHLKGLSKQWLEKRNGK